MSFEKLSKKDLVAVAEEFGVESTGTKETIIAALDAEGVTFELVESLKAAADQNADGEAEATPAAPVASGPEVILAFRGLGGYNNPFGDWSAKSPYSVVPKSVADELIAELPHLFEVASESEVESFYN